MRIARLHSWPTDAHEAIELQNELRDRLDLRGSGRRGPWRRVAGADVSYDRGGDLLHAAVVVIQLPSLDVIETATATAPMRFPYVPGLLSFREAPPVLAAFRRVRSRPEAVLFDAHGLAHPRRFGLACHLGMWLGLPAVGCAKSRLVRVESETGPAVGDRAPLVHDGRHVGDTLRTRRGCKPVYVSQGFRIGLPAARRLVLACGAGYRLPEPTRQAHLAVNRHRLEHGHAGKSRPTGRQPPQRSRIDSKNSRSRAR